MTRVMPLRALAGAAVASALLVGLAAPAQADTSAPVSTTVVAPRVAAPSAALAALPVLGVGSTGTYVRRVQVMLHIPSTGRFDAAVRAAVIAFQRRYGLRANGLVGASVWGALIADWRIYLRTPRLAAAAAAPAGLLNGEPAASRNRAVTYSLRGVFASAYTGSYYDARFETKRRCIVARESHGYYTVRSANGLYHGAYQMTAALGVGVTKKMLASVAAEVGSSTAAALMARLRLVSPSRWSRYWQDRAFWTIFNHGAGAAHWAGGYVSC